MKLNPIKKNMTVLEVDDKEILFSYSTPVAAIVRGVLFVVDVSPSATTTRHIYEYKLRGGYNDERKVDSSFFKELTQ
jgi:hypothetical protein